MNDAFSLGCPRCAAPLPIDGSTDRLECGSCGRSIAVERRGDAITLRLVENATRETELARIQRELGELRRPRTPRPRPRWNWKARLGMVIFGAAAIGGLAHLSWAIYLFGVGLLYSVVTSHIQHRDESREIEAGLRKTDDLLAQLRKLAEE